MKPRSLTKSVVFWLLILILSCATGPKVKEIAALHYGDGEAGVVQILGEGSQTLLFRLDGINYSYRYYTTTITNQEYALLFADGRLHAVSQTKPPFAACINRIQWDECFRLAISKMQSERLVTEEGGFSDALSKEHQIQKNRTGAAVIGAPVLIVALPIVVGVGAMCVAQGVISGELSPSKDMEQSRQKAECSQVFKDIESRLDGLYPTSGMNQAIKVINTVSTEYAQKITTQHYDLSEGRRRIYGSHLACGDYSVRTNLFTLFGGEDDVIVWKSKNIEPDLTPEFIGLPALPPPSYEFISPEQANTFLQMYWNYPNYKDAKKWLCRSADAGNAEAQYRLGLLYETGSEGVPNNKVKAFMWYRLSASSGNYMRSLDNALRVYQSLTEEQAAAADMFIQEWKPGQCEHDLQPVEASE
jgi:hypothetical protein